LGFAEEDGSWTPIDLKVQHPLGDPTIALHLLHLQQMRVCTPVLACQCHARIRWQSISQIAAAALVQIVETRLGDGSRNRAGAVAEVAVADGALHISCGGGGVLKVPAVEDRAHYSTPGLGPCVRVWTRVKQGAASCSTCSTSLQALGCSVDATLAASALCPAGWLQDPQVATGLLRRKAVSLPQVLRLQLAGKRVMSVTDFVNGFVKGRAIQAHTAEDSSQEGAAGKQQGHQSEAQGPVRTQECEQPRAGTG
jgi:hypothetical protein